MARAAALHSTAKVHYRFFFLKETIFSIWNIGPICLMCVRAGERGAGGGGGGRVRLGAAGHDVRGGTANDFIIVLIL